MPRPLSTLARVLFVSLLTLPLGGCQIGPKRIGGTTPVDVQLDRLRDENNELRARVRELEQAVELRVAQIESLEQQRANGHGVSTRDGVSPGDLPRPVALRFDRYTAALDKDGDGRDELVRAYVKPVDQRGRFLPVEGRAVVQVVAIPPQAAAEPVVLAERTYSPEQWRDAYRSNFTGTHYTLEAPLEPAPPGVNSATLKVTFTDAGTGATLAREQVIAVK